MKSSLVGNPRVSLWASLLVTALLMAAIVSACLIAPTEASMGHSQRIVYVHVAVAWMGLAGFPLMAGAGMLYLRSRRLTWQAWAQAVGEVSWLCGSLTLVTGSLWAHEAWGTWWTWDPRLTTAFILWVLYSAYLLVGRSLEDPHQRARMGAVLAVVGALEVPLVLFATRLFRGMHPKSPEAEPLMLVALLISVTGFSTFFASLMLLRRRQLGLDLRLTEIEQSLDC